MSEKKEEKLWPIQKILSYLPECKVTERDVVPKNWGIFDNQRHFFKVGEVAVYDNEKNGEEGFLAETVKLLYIQQNKKLSLHYHAKKIEIFYLVKGSLKLELWKNGMRYICIMSERDCIKIPPHLIHQMTGLDTENILLEVSTQDMPEDSYRVIKGD